MLTCLPVSLCSWDFQVSGLTSSSASIDLDFFTEQGSISLGASKFAVRKHGPLSGHWTLESDGRVLANALKPNALFRAFEIQANTVRFTVKAQSVLTRCYDILLGDKPLGVIRPAHPFTRRAFIECTPEIPEVAQLFAFWMVVITWRRAANRTAATK